MKLQPSFVESLTRLEAMTRKELLALPYRNWDDDSQLFDSLIILSTGRKHDSGFACMAIIGVKDRNPMVICSSCSDDIEWKLPPASTFGPKSEYTIGQFRTDCLWRSGALHAWTNSGKFKVGCALSSITIELVL